MSVSVKHLNADSTFLISFWPETQTSQSGRIAPYSILVDPWLAGSSSIWNARFQISHHTSDSVVSSLADIELPDIIIISQDKPDHCHRETLQTLPADTPVRILAVPAAAKKIKSWRYFTRATITCISPYNPKNPDTVLRLPIKPHDALFGLAGELTVSYIPQRLDVTNLHNAIGITYSPPNSSRPLDQNGLPITLPLSPPLTPVMSRSNSHPPRESADTSVDMASILSFDPPQTLQPFKLPQPTKPLSILYTPHGIGVPCISSFMNNHLAPMDALPLTIFFHSINVEQNPWFLGGKVASGFPGGVQLVRTFGAKYWLSAHDEVKDNRGWSTAMIKSRQYTVDEAQVLLDDELERAEETREPRSTETGGNIRDPPTTHLVNLGVGEELSI